MKRPESVTRPGMNYLKWRRWESMERIRRSAGIMSILP